MFPLFLALLLQNGVLEGVVLAADTGSPLPKARVTISKPQGNVISQYAVTGRDGRFRFALEPGVYSVHAARNGYARQEAGQRAQGRPGTNITILPGQRLTDIVFRLVRTASVSGRVLDFDGEPFLGVNVQLWRIGYDSDGNRAFRPGVSARTNDLGEYRLHSLMPGRYYITATPQPPLRAEVINLNEVVNPEGYPTIFYPGTADSMGASPIELGSGTDARGVDFMMRPGRTFTIRGRVTFAVSDAPRGNVRFSIRPRRVYGIFLATSPAVRYSEDGSFEIRDLTNGAYVVTAEVAGASQYKAEMAVDVAGANVENVALVINRGVEVVGHVLMEDRSDQPAPGDPREVLREPQIGFRPVGSFTNTVWQALVRGDHSFRLGNVPQGVYRVVVQNLPGDSYVKAIRFSGADVTNQDIVLTGQTGTFEVVLASHGAHLDGFVTTSQGTSAANSRVVLVPDVSLRHRSDLYRVTTTDQYGRFIMTGLPLGSYKLFAWEYIEFNAHFDPDFIRRYEDRGTAIRFSEGQQNTVGLKIIEDE